VHKLVCPRGVKLKLNADNWHTKYAKTVSGDVHVGKLELVTWDFKEEDGEEFSWGGQLKVLFPLYFYYFYYNNQLLGRGITDNMGISYHYHLIL